MGIWVRSQNKEILMNLEYFEIQEPNYEEVKAVIFSSGYILGRYSTKEKALKVLDEIASWIDGLEFSRNVKSCRCNFVYQMPDDEVK